MSTIPHFEHSDPYPWQRCLYGEFLRGVVRPWLYLPTGTGKTSAALLYLLAVAQGAPLPRRLAYVVDRRAIVDQTRARIEAWVEALETGDLAGRVDALAAFPRPESDAARTSRRGGRVPAIPVGVLRGGLADSGEWRMDPARPGVVVGTVDMIGSRLLFSGYGDGRSRRSLHAGLLGQDTTVMLDEAHLSVPMERLLRRLVAVQGEDGEEQPERRRLRVMAMSATPTGDAVAGWDTEDEADPGFRARLHATKRVRLHAVEGPAALAPRIAEVALGIRHGSVVVYVREVRVASGIYRALVRGTGDQARVGLLTGTLRGLERDRLLDTGLWGRFMRDRARDAAEAACYLVSTAAGEVGIDLDADHAVMDLAPADSVAQRVGRVNRNGMSAGAQVHVVHEESPKEAPRRETLELLRGCEGLSPAEVAALASEKAAAWAAAISPVPKVAPIDRGRIEALATTSDPYRDPAVDVFLRGVEDDREAVQTQVVWRRDLAALLAAGHGYVERALEGFPPAPREVLTAPSWVVAAELSKMASRLESYSMVVRGARGETSVVVVSEEVVPRVRDIAYGTVFLPAEAGGLAVSGLLDGRTAQPVEDCADDETRMRYEVVGDESAERREGWVILEVPLNGDTEGDRAWLDDDEVAGRRLVYRRADVAHLMLAADRDEFTSTGLRQQTLAEHGATVGEAAERLARALGLPDAMVGEIAKAGRCHDTGKAARTWQRAAGWPDDGLPMAKSSGRFNVRLLDGYRHEFGSVLEAEGGQPPASALCLHLVAAHHGHARPGFASRRHWGGSLPDAELEESARRVETRFDALQREYGPWGLAWLEAIVKAADAWVSSGGELA